MADSAAITRRFPKDHPPGEALLKAVEANDARLARAREGRLRKAEEVVEAARRRRRDLVGKANWLELRRLMRREEMAFRDRLQPPAGLTLDIRKANAARKAKANAFLRQHGIDQAKLRKISLDAGAALRELLVRGEGKVVPGYSLNLHAKEWGGLSPNNLIAYPWESGVSDDPHRWHVFTAPFMGSETSTWFRGSSGADGSAAMSVHAASGLVSVAPATVEIADADDIDFGGTDAYAAVMCWFEAPATGLVEVLIDAQNLDCEHSLDTEDEWGFSDSWTEQLNHLTLKLIHPNSLNLSDALMSRFYLETDEDQTTRVSYLNRGQHYFAHLYGDGPVQAGEHVYIAVGTHTYDYCSSNDVGMKSDSTFRWFIKSVQARISP